MAKCGTKRNKGSIAVIDNSWFTFEISELKGIGHGIIKAFETWRWSSVPFISQHFWQQHFVIQKYTTAVTSQLK